ncbi:MAG: hypothetical protein IPK71_10385 [Myxococcales bacterium]|jgi:hypothetical protein|nr:hypothetical protein [Myxococcales bacterium]
MNDGLSDEMQVHGALMVGFAQACVNLNIVAGQEATRFIGGLQINDWYPLSEWEKLQKLVIRSYANVDPIMVKVGIAMMHGWYHFGPGKSAVKKGVSFLHYQTGSGGFASVVRGPESVVGSFELEQFDKTRGLAVVHSTTPFDRKMECGVLIGGMTAPGDVDYVDVTNTDDPDRLIVEFH